MVRGKNLGLPIETTLPGTELETEKKFYQGKKIVVVCNISVNLKDDFGLLLIIYVFVYKLFDYLFNENSSFYRLFHQYPLKDSTPLPVNRHDTSFDNPKVFL